MRRASAFVGLLPTVATAVATTACVPAGRSVAFPETNVPFAALFLIDGTGQILQSRWGTADQLGAPIVLAPDQALIYAPIAAQRIEVDLDQLAHAEFVPCEDDCSEANFAAPGFVDLPFSSLVGELFILRAGASGFELHDENPIASRTCVRFVESPNWRSPPLEPPIAFHPSGRAALERGVIDGAERDPEDERDFAKYFELFRVLRLDETRVFALTRGMLYWFERERDYGDSSHEGLSIADTNDAGHIWHRLALDPTRHADGTWRVIAISIREAEDQVPGVLFELGVSDAGIEWFEERYRSDDDTLKDVAWVDGTGFVAVGSRGLIVTATAAAGPWTETSAPVVDTLERVHPTGSSTFPIAIGTANGSLLLMQTLVPVPEFTSYSAFAASTNVLSIASRLGDSDEDLTVWMGGFGGRLGRIRLPNDAEFRALPVTLPRDNRCGGGRVPCGGRSMGHTLRDLHWIPGGAQGQIVAAISDCGGVLTFHADDGRGTVLWPEIESVDLARGLSTDPTRITLVGDTGQVMEMMRR